MTFSNNKWLMIVGIAMAVVVVAVVIYMLFLKSKKSWTDAERSQVSALLAQKSFFNCSKSSTSNPCLLKKLESRFTSQEATDLLSGKVVRPLSSEEMKYFGQCMDKNCLLEVLLTEHAPMGPECGKCMVDAALKETNGSILDAGAKLHDADALTKYLLACKCTSK